MLFVKIIHMSVASFILLMLLVRVIQFLRHQIGNNVSNPKQNKLMFVIPHILYTILLITGIWMLVSIFKTSGSVPYWIIAKIILFMVAVSAGFKMTRVAASREQYRAGLIVAGIAYGCIIMLVVLKPGLIKTTVQSPAIPVVATTSTD